jgi:putative two-component system response regulator
MYEVGKKELRTRRMSDSGQREPGVTRGPVLGRARRPRVLCVDDEPLILRLLDRMLGGSGMEVVTSGEAGTALETFPADRFDLVITDIRMPGMSGHEFVQGIRARDPQVPIIVITGQGTVENAAEMIRNGANGMLLKPFTLEELMREVTGALERARERHDALELRLVTPLLDGVALSWSKALENRDLETAEHCRALGAYGERVAIALGFDRALQTTIRIGGFLHDIGKIGIPDRILLKPGALTDEEIEQMRRHSQIGAEILEQVHESLAGIAGIVRHHHEQWNGSGYPDHLAGAAIPIGARIISVADAFNSMTIDRPYRLALPVERAWDELARFAGTQFDPVCVDAFRATVNPDGSIIPA